MNKDEYKQLYEQVCEQYDVLAKELAAIKQALAAQQEHEPENEPFVSLASVQEPVAYEYHEYRPYGAPGEIRINAILKSRYAMPDGSTAGDYQWLIDQYRANKNTIKLIPLYTTPPAAQRQWVGLTEKEILECRSANHLHFYLAIQAKLKEKNNG